jgi:hypothetical protein
VVERFTCFSIEEGEVSVLASFAFKGITRNPEKLLLIIDHVLRVGGTVVTPNYLLSPTYLARRNPLLRPAHSSSEVGGKFADPTGLGSRHRELLAAMNGD